MDPVGSCGYGRAAEAQNRSFSSSPQSFSIPLRSMPSLQPRASPVYSPDTRVFNTPEQGSHLPNRNEGLFSGRCGFTRAEPEHAFQEQLQQYATEQLGKEWDSLFLGNETDDLRDGVDIYRKIRKDFRALACAMKQSFELVVDNRRYSGDGRGSSSVQQLQPCIAELKSVAKDMASVTRMANDNYNLQVELTLQKHASQHLLAQLHEAQLARMSMEEDITVLRAEAQRAVTTESSMAHLRRLNDELQAEAQQASGELLDMERRMKEMEAQLEAKVVESEELAAKLRHIELYEDIGSHVQLRDLCGSSDGTASDGGGIGFQQQQAYGAEHFSAGGWVAAANSRSAAGGLVPEGLAAEPHESGSRRHMQVPLELRYTLGKVLRRRDADAEKLRMENLLLAEEVARLQEALSTATATAAAETVAGNVESHRQAATSAPGTVAVGTACTHSVYASGRLQLEQRSATPLRLSSDSWHTDDDFEWAKRPVARLLDAHPHAGAYSRNGGDSGQPLRSCQDSSRHRRQHLQVRQPQQEHEQQREGLSQHAVQQQHIEHKTREDAALAADFQDARTAIIRLTQELAEAKERQRALEAQIQTTIEEARDRQSEVRAAVVAAVYAQSALAKAQAAEAESRTQLQVVLTKSTLDCGLLKAELDEFRHTVKAEAGAADAAAAVAASETEGLASRNNRMAADLEEARQKIACLELQLADSARAHVELQERLGEADQCERHTRESAAKELETVRQRLARAQENLLDYRAEAQAARSEATATSRDAKAANSEKQKAQREKEEAVERLRQAEAERDAMTVRLAEAEAQQRRLQEQLEQAEEQLARVEVEAVVDDEAVVQHVFVGADGGKSEAAVGALVSELDAVKQELVEVRQRLVQERQMSEQEVRRLQAQLVAVQAQLGAAQSELAIAVPAAQERMAMAEARLTLSNSAAAVIQEQHMEETARLQALLEEAQRRVDAQQHAEVRLQSLEKQLQEAHMAQQQAEQLHREELEALQVRLVEAQQAVDVATVLAATAAAADASQGSSASSSDAGISGGGGVPEREVLQGIAAPRAQEDVGLSAGDAGWGEFEDEDGDDLVTMRARCRALRGELALARGWLADLIAAAEAAAQGRLDEALEEAKAAAAAGLVTSDEEFWAFNDKIHSLHALVASLRATCMYAGSAGACSTYGDTRADGAGSVVAASSRHLVSSRRRQQLLKFREQFGQVAELLSEAETLSRSAVPPPPSQPPRLRYPTETAKQHDGIRDGVVGLQNAVPLQALGAASSRTGAMVASDLQLRYSLPAGHESGRAMATSHDSVPDLDFSGLLTSYGVAAARTLADASGKPHEIFDLGSLGLFTSGEGGEIGISGAGSSYFGTGDGAVKGVGARLPPAPVASSSFTSDTGSSLADDDLTSLSNLYEIPPMASPPKFDFSDMDFGKLF